MLTADCISVYRWEREGWAFGYMGSAAGSWRFGRDLCFYSLLDSFERLVYGVRDHIEAAGNFPTRRGKTQRSARREP